MNKIKQYFKDSWSELGKVTWPTKNQAVMLALVVIGVCAIFAAIMGVMDYCFGFGMEELLKLAKQ